MFGLFTTKNTVTATTQESKMDVHQGKLGYYPCDYATYRKLKELNRIASEAYRVDFAWDRWNKKHPQNRFWKKPTYRYERVGYDTKKVVDIPGVPMVEPTCFAKITSRYIEDFHNARMPRSTPEGVRPLRYSIQQIDDLLAEARLWFLNFQEWKEKKKAAKNQE